MLWALSKLRLPPGSAWLATAQGVAQSLLPLMSAQHTSMLLYALATLPREGRGMGAQRAVAGELLEAAVDRLSQLLLQVRQAQGKKRKEMCPGAAAWRWQGV